MYVAFSFEYIMNFREQFELNTDLVHMKLTSDPDLRVLKYHRKVFYANLWSDFLEECRGVVIDKDFNIVSRPFRKIYNYGVEVKAPKIDHDEMVYAFRKINGFMVAMTWHNDDVLVSTTGSIDSDFVVMARKYLTDTIREFVQMYKEFTLMFECCDPSDPHIVEEKTGLYFLGARHKATGELNANWLFHYNKHAHEYMGTNPVEAEEIRFGDLVDKVKTVKHEGFVIYTKDGRSTKIKSPHYLTKKLFMRGNLDKLFAKDIKASIDEEYFPLVDYVNANKDVFMASDEMERRRMIEEFLNDR